MRRSPRQLHESHLTEPLAVAQPAATITLQELATFLLNVPITQFRFPAATELYKAHIGFYWQSGVMTVRIDNCAHSTERRYTVEDLATVKIVGNKYRLHDGCEILCFKLTPMYPPKPKLKSK